MNAASTTRSERWSRRQLLVASAVVAGVAGPLGAARVWAQNRAGLDANAFRTLTAMARRLYPHDAIADAVYAEVLDDAIAATAGDPSLGSHFRDAERALESAQGESFVDLDESAQIERMHAVESTEFFTAIQAAVRDRIYGHPAVWALLGYEGPSFRFGGYLNRGAGEIDWLPETD